MTIISSPITKNYNSQGLDQLRARVGGQVITPNDENYDTARQAWNLTRQPNIRRLSLLPGMWMTLSRQSDLRRQRV